LEGSLSRLCTSFAIGVILTAAGIVAQAAVPGEPQGVSRDSGGSDQVSPSLDLTAALLQAGGGLGHFSMQTALVNMLGQADAKDEIARLRRRYGAAPVHRWLQGSDWLMLQGLTQLRNTGTDLPEPSSELAGSRLAAALVQAGIAPGDKRFQTDYYYDHLFSRAVNKVLETGMDRKFSERYAKSVSAINDQAMSDISQQILIRSTTLAKLH
jgi:hypothetical protein